MKYKTEILATFKKEFKRLLKRYPSLIEDVKTLRQNLEAFPDLGTDLGGGLRKVRMRITSKGKGKSGGARVITLTVIISTKETEIDLLYIYDKAERSTISRKEIDELLTKNDLK